MKNPLHAAVLSSAFFFLLLMASGCQQPEERPPNFVFILVDDLGWNDLSCYGSTFYETPNLDRFAAQSMRFTNAYAAGSVCSPTRAAIMTGKNPVRVDITDWIPGQNPKKHPLIGPQDRNELALSETTMAEAFRQQAYKTFFAGKWHLGNEGYLPEDQGFDINKGGHHRGSPPGGYYSPYKNPKLSNGPEGEYLPDRLTNESIRFLEENRDSSFLLFLSFYTVHTPIQASKRHLAKFEAKAKTLPNEGTPVQEPEGDGLTLTNQVRPDYASMVYAMDENVGRLLAKLEEMGLDENTVVIFTSDNGGLSTLQQGRNLAPTSVRPLRGGKGWLYEGGIRVPLIIRAPGVTQARESEIPVISHDLYPTMWSLANLLQPPGELDGMDLSSILKGETSFERDALYWHYPHYHGSAWKPGSAIRAGDWKLVEFHETGKVELFNLKDDLGETQDLAATHPEKTEELKQKLHTWQEQMNAKFASPNPNYEN